MACALHSLGPGGWEVKISENQKITSGLHYKAKAKYDSGVKILIDIFLLYIHLPCLRRYYDSRSFIIQATVWFSPSPPDLGNL